MYAKYLVHKRLLSSDKYWINAVCALFFLCTPFLTSFRHFLFSCFGLLARDERHLLFRRLIASCAGAELTRYSGVGSTLKRCVQCSKLQNFSSERVRREATEWSDMAVGRLGGVWGPLRHCDACKSSHMSCKNTASHLWLLMWATKPLLCL